MAKFKKSQQKGAPPWLVSMGDLNNLLMCFFIVLMGEEVVQTNQEDFLLLLSAFRGNVGLLDGGKSFTRGKLAEMGQNMMSLPATKKDRQLSRSGKNVRELLKPEIASKLVRVREDERGLIITLASDAFFEPGSAHLNEQIKPVLNKIVGMVKEIPNFVRIEGHTDNRLSIPGAAKTGFETNWELSSARSVNVLRYFAEENKVDPKRLSAVAFGQHRPIDNNDTPEGRAYNRRVDIVILRDRPLEESKHKDIKRPLPDEEWR